MTSYPERFESRIQALADRLLDDYGNERFIDRLEMFTQPDRKTIEELFKELAAKIAANDPNSRTVAEFNKGIHAIGKKIVEEAAEVWMAAEFEDEKRTAEEISQLIYHLMVMMLRKKCSLEDLYRLL